MAIIKTDCKMTLQQVVQKYKCTYAINGGLYNMKTGKVNKIPLRIDGKTIATSSDGYWMMAWNEGSDLCMIHSKDMNKWKNAIACSTMLKDGKETIFNYTSAQGGIRGRTAFGDDDNNVHICVTTDKKEPMSPKALRSKCKQNGAKNMIMNDCGGSSQLYYNGVYLQAEKRKVSYWICIWTTPVTMSSTTKPRCPYQQPTISVKYGSRGNGARWVQWYLQELGFYKGTIDGIFGNKSKEALIEFQKTVFTNKDDHDGICGSMTRKKLVEVYNKK